MVEEVISVSVGDLIAWCNTDQYYSDFAISLVKTYFHHGLWSITQCNTPCKVELVWGWVHRDCCYRNAEFSIRKFELQFCWNPDGWFKAYQKGEPWNVLKVLECNWSVIWFFICKVSSVSWYPFLFLCKKNWKAFLSGTRRLSNEKELLRQ